MSHQRVSGRGRREAAPAASPGGRLVGLEGLRGLAAIAILIVHVTSQLAPSMDHGMIARGVALLTQGLTLFFVLSGFLLFRPFVIRFLSGTPRPAVAPYFTRRLLRIFPAYLVVLTLAGLVLGVVNTRALHAGEGEAELRAIVGHITDPTTFLVDMTMMQTYIPAYLKTGLGVAWTLTVELTFYIILPFLCRLLLRGDGGPRARVARAFGPVLALVLLGIGGRILLAALVAAQPGVDPYTLEWGDNGTAVVARSILLTAQLFAAGMAASIVVAIVETGMIAPAKITGIRIAAMGLALVALVVCVAGIERDNSFAIAAAALIVFLSLPDSRGHVGRVAWSLDSWPFRRAGDVSYSVYLWHVPVIWLLQRGGLVLPSSLPGLLGNLVIVGILTFLVAAVTYRFVEAPAMRYASVVAKRQGAKAALRPGRGAPHGVRWRA